MCYFGDSSDYLVTVECPPTITGHPESSHHTALAAFSLSSLIWDDLGLGIGASGVTESSLIVPRMTYPLVCGKVV